MMKFPVKIIISALLLMSTTPAMALEFTMNAMCYMQDKNGQVYPFNPTKTELSESTSKWVKKVPTNVTESDVREKFRIASLSKILVTHWAMATLGPEYRFTTRVHITPTNSDKSCFVHLSGDQDIFFGEEIIRNAFRQIKNVMKKQKCEQVGQLSYDEKIVIPMKGDNFIIGHRNDAGFRGNEPTQYYTSAVTMAALSKIVKTTSEGKSLQVKKIARARAQDFETYRQTTPVKTFSFQSRPLYMMVREFNAYSSNVPANILFEKLGGRDNYKKFIATRLSIGDLQMDVYNGSGYPVNPNSDRKDNLVSCNSFVHVMQDLEQILHNYKSVRKFQIADIMAVGGSKEKHYTTITSLYSNEKWENTLAAKTGSANNAITFGGLLSTSEGSLYFGVLTNPEKYKTDELYQPRQYIYGLMDILSKRYQLKKFDYTQIGLMTPIDEFANFKEESTNFNSLK